jgi:hypothetical protein
MVKARALYVALVLLVMSAPAFAATPRVNQHGFGFGYHTVLFQTASDDDYTLHGPSVVYDFFLGRRWGFMLRGALYVPVFGSMHGPSGEWSGSLLDGYEQRHLGFDALLLLARRLPLSTSLVLSAGGGLHLQSFALVGSQYSPVEEASLGLGGLGKLDYLLSDSLSMSVQFETGLDFVDLIDHRNPADFLIPLSASFAFAARF